MTKKDYELLARVMSNSRNEAVDPNTQWHRIVERLSAELKQDNPSFDREKFIKACNS